MLPLLLAHDDLLSCNAVSAVLPQLEQRRCWQVGPAISPAWRHCALEDVARLPEQSMDTVGTAGSTGLLQQEAAVPSAARASSDADQTHDTSCRNRTEAPGMPDAQSDHNSELSSAPGQTPLEEGELPDADEQLQEGHAQPDNPADEVLLPSQQATVESAAVPAPVPATTVKRKRGERAGKRVRQREARRTRDAELSLLLPGSRMRAPQAPKRLLSEKHLPTCK